MENGACPDAAGREGVSWFVELNREIAQVGLGPTPLEFKKS